MRLSKNKKHWGLLLAGSVLIMPELLSTHTFVYFTDPFWVWQFLGRLHPMIVHLPLSFLLLAGMLELVTIKNYRSRWRPTIELMLWVGGITAVLSAGLGYLLMVQDGYEGAGVDIHQNLGIATAVLSVFCLWMSRTRNLESHKNWLISYRSTLFLATITLILTGHFGASLTHGNDYLTEVLPMKSGEKIEADLDIDLSVYNRATDDIPEQDMLHLLTAVRTIFAHSCYRCHSSDKIKGELRLDEREFVFAGGENGSIIQAGEPEQSELIRRISLPAGHDDVMPNKGDLLSKEQIEMVALWVEKGAYWPENADELKIFRNAPLAPRIPEWPADTSEFANKIDVWVDEYFSEKQIQWKKPVDDRTYLRRIYLDIVGLTPSPEELEQFQSDTRPDKREIWAKNLLDQDEDYALHWLTFWNDILRNDYTGTGYITGGRHSITDWLYQALFDNMPYQQMVRELLNPDNESKGFIEGIQWRGVVNASQRTEMQAAQNISQLFLGLNLKCASCHDSFISDWKLSDAYGFANIFADSTLEINRCDKPTGKFASTKIIFEDLGDIDSTLTVEEKLEQLAGFLTAPKNGRLYRTIVNRMWAQLMGRGIVHPVDLMDNEPWSQDLLDWMASDFVDNGHDLKDLLFTITTSRTYQLPSVEPKDEYDLIAADYTFRAMHRRRLSAAQFADALSMIVHPVYQ